MDYEEALSKLDQLRTLMHKQKKGKCTEDEHEQMVFLYGELEEVIRLVDGDQPIEVDMGRGTSTTFPNVIAAAILSGWSNYHSTGHAQLMKVIGKVRALVDKPGLPGPPASLSTLVGILRRFRECCQHLKSPIGSERDVQDILWIMLRSHFDLLEREETLPKFGVKAYRPDFGVPDLRALIEVKFIGEKSEPPRIQEEILADISAYVGENSRYAGVIVFIYDHAHKLLDPGKLVSDLKSVDGVIDVIVVPGVSAPA